MAISPINYLRWTAASAGASVGLTLEAVGQILGHSQALGFEANRRAAADVLRYTRTV